MNTNGWCLGFVTDEDGERVCECGDEGRLCEPCKKYESAYWEEECRNALLSEVDPEGFAEQMLDAGRGHLVREIK